MDTFKLCYTVLGGLGIFFYGMKSMSEALQAVAGDAIKNIINSLTSNRIFAVFVGMAVTMIVQSSSVTTVMVVGFVNAGLMNLAQAIGIILGANIGTTITGWIISIKISKYGLLMISLGIFPIIFAKSTRWKQTGRVLFGVGMIFFGLQIMSSAFKPLRTMPEFLDYISYFDGQHFGAYLACVIVGCLLTMIIQSSSAMLGITIALGISGVISFHTAAALVLGENIGTTITALLASIGGNVNAKRAARAHAVFNLLGVAVMLMIFPYYVDFIEWLIPGDANFINAAGEKPNIAVHVATSHSIFNVTATLLFLPFLNTLARLVIKMTPESVGKERHKLILLGNPSDILPATALAQAQAEVINFKEIVDRMFALTIQYVSDEKNVPKVLAKIKNYECITDNIQKEVTVFVCKVMERSLTTHQSAQAQSMVRVADELESVADYLERLALYKIRFNDGMPFIGEAKRAFFELFNNVENFYHSITKSLDNIEHLDMVGDDKRSEEIRLQAENIRHNHLDRVAKGEYAPLTALTYSDMVVALRKIRSHSHNISQSLFRSSGFKQQPTQNRYTIRD